MRNAKDCPDQHQGQRRMLALFGRLTLDHCALQDPHTLQPNTFKQLLGTARLASHDILD